MIPPEFFKQSISSEIQTKLVVSNFRVKLDSTLKRCRGKRRKAEGKDDDVLFHVRIFLLLVLLVLLLVWFGSGFLTCLGDQVSDLASVGLEHIPNVEHVLKSTVEFKPYRPAGMVQKYLGNAFLFPQMLPSFNTQKSEFSTLKCCWSQVGHFLLGGRLDLLKMGRECVCGGGGGGVCACVCFADVQALIQQSLSAVSD